MVNVLAYRLRAGCQWCLLPPEFPDDHLVYYYVRRWTRDGTWDRLHDHLREEARVRAGRAPANGRHH